MSFDKWIRVQPHNNDPPKRSLILLSGQFLLSSHRQALIWFSWLLASFAYYRNSDEWKCALWTLVSLATFAHHEGFGTNPWCWMYQWFCSWEIFYFMCIWQVVYPCIKLLHSFISFCVDICFHNSCVNIREW